MKETMYIFVYGTLMKGFRNYKKYLEGKVFSSRTGYVKGMLYHLENKDYPGFVPDGDGRVYGEILEIPKDYTLMDDLDMLEGCKEKDCVNQEYCKKDLKVFTEDGKFFDELAVYVYNLKAKVNSLDDRILLESGSWKEYRRK